MGSVQWTVAAAIHSVTVGNEAPALSFGHVRATDREMKLSSASGVAARILRALCGRCRREDGERKASAAARAMSHLAREVPTGPVAVEDGAPQLDWLTFTVLIPSFNREHLIARALDSVDRQSYRHVEILLIDDGSTDHTAWRLSCWTLKARTRIRYLRQPNSGTHRAYNEGVLGSDDELAPDALMRLAVHWMAIAPQMRAQYCGVAGHGLLRDSQRILGDAFPAPVYDASYLELTCRLRISGDKPGAWRRDLLLAHPFPVVPGERFMLDNFVLRQLGLRYRTRYIQEVISLFEYQPDGLTARRREVRMQAPQGMANYFLHDANAFTRGYGLRALSCARALRALRVPRTTRHAPAVPRRRLPVSVADGAHRRHGGLAARSSEAARPPCAGARAGGGDARSGACGLNRRVRHHRFKRRRAMRGCRAAACSAQC